LRRIIISSHSLPPLWSPIWSFSGATPIEVEVAELRVTTEQVDTRQPSGRGVARPRRGSGGEASHHVGAAGPRRSTSRWWMRIWGRVEHLVGRSRWGAGLLPSDAKAGLAATAPSRRSGVTREGIAAPAATGRRTVCAKISEPSGVVVAAPAATKSSVQRSHGARS
jgi:hypothetical protein